MTRRTTTVAVFCFVEVLTLWLAVPTAHGRRTTGPNAYPITVRADALARGGSVATSAAIAAGCTRLGLPAPGVGSVIIGIDACGTAPPPGGWVQFDQVFEAPYPSTVLTVRVIPPTGTRQAIASVRRAARARILLDGHPVWEARAMKDDGGHRYIALTEPNVAMTLVIKKRSPHVLRFETEPGAIWMISSIEITARATPTPLRGIAYSPYRDCQTPTSARQPTTGDLDDDMYRIVHSSNAVRTYAATGINRQIAAAAEALGHTVYAGAWLDRVDGDDAELRALLDLARSSRLAGLIVSNEFYLRHRGEGRAAVDYLLDRIRLVKAALPARHPPIMVADVDGVMFQWACEDGVSRVKSVSPEYQPVLDATDAVLVHIYPFWDGRSITGAAAVTAARYVAIRDFVARKYPGKRVIIGETGWPSAGARVGDAVPGPAAQRQYMAEFMQLADMLAIEYFYFDAFDEGWKVQEPGHVGQHWGYADSTRAAKYDISGTLLPGALLAQMVGAPAAVKGMMCGGTAGQAPGADASTAAAPRSDNVSRAGVIYSEWLSDDSKFVPVGWMGDAKKADLFECDRSAPHGGEMAVRAEFSPDGKDGWAGVVWQDPASDWGRHAGGYDLRGVDRVTFWVKGDRGGEVVEFKVGGIGTPQDPYRDTIRPARSSGPLILTGDWRPVTIGLAGADLSRVVGGFSWVASRCNNPQPISFLIDDVRFEVTPGAQFISQHLARKPFYVYDDDGSGCGHYVPSGFMGDIGDLAVDPRSTEAPFKGHTAIQVTYRRSGRQANRWAGVYWQEPAGNWGTLQGGYDLSWATVLTFYAKGRHGGEAVEFFAGGLGNATSHYPDSAPKRSTEVVHLTKGWQRYSIDLRGQDLRRIAGGFGFALSVSGNPDGAEFFLDEIAYEQR